MSWDIDVDFVSVGAGVGGLCGAITAAHQGLRALALESSSLFGGVSALSLGLLWIPGNFLEAQAGIKDDWQQGLDYVRWMGGGFGDASLARAWCEASPEAVRFLADVAGVRLQLVHLPDYYFPQGENSKETGRYLEAEPFDGEQLGQDRFLTRKGERSSMAMGERLNPAQAPEAPVADRRALGGGLAAYLVAAARRMGVELMANVQTQELIREDGRITGLLARYEGRLLRIRARKGVLLATSGFDRNHNLVRATDARLGQPTLVPPAVRGEHLRLAGLHGARVLTLAARPQWVGTSFRSSDETDAEGLERWHSFNFRKPHVMMVNGRGQRFCDETWGPSYVSALSHVDINGPALKNQPFFAIFDARYRERYPVGAYGVQDELPTVVHSAPTLEQLAQRLGLDGGQLQQSAARFNQIAAAGQDEDFGRGSRPQTLLYGDQAYPNPVLGSIDRPPFYGVRLDAASIGIPTMGLDCDERGRVLDWNGDAIPGLYAAGNSMAMKDLGIGYNSGIANTRGMTFGYLSALDCGTPGSVGQRREGQSA